MVIPQKEVKRINFIKKVGYWPQKVYFRAGPSKLKKLNPLIVRRRKIKVLYLKTRKKPYKRYFYWKIRDKLFKRQTLARWAAARKLYVRKKRLTKRRFIKKRINFEIKRKNTKEKFKGLVMLRKGMLKTPVQKSLNLIKILIVFRSILGLRRRYFLNISQFRAGYQIRRLERRVSNELKGLYRNFSLFTKILSARFVFRNRIQNYYLIKLERFKSRLLNNSLACVLLKRRIQSLSSNSKFYWILNKRLKRRISLSLSLLRTSFRLLVKVFRLKRSSFVKSNPKKIVYSRRSRRIKRLKRIVRSFFRARYLVRFTGYHRRFLWYRRPVKSGRFRFLKIWRIRLNSFRVTKNSYLPSTSVIVYRQRLFSNVFSIFRAFRKRRVVLFKLKKTTGLKKRRWLRNFLITSCVPVKWHKKILTKNIFKLAIASRYSRTLFKANLDFIRASYIVRRPHKKRWYKILKKYWFRKVRRSFLSFFRGRKRYNFKSTGFFSYYYNYRKGLVLTRYGILNGLRFRLPAKNIGLELHHIRYIAKFRRRWGLRRFFALLLKYIYLRRRLTRAGKIFRWPVRKLIVKQSFTAEHSSGFALLNRLPQTLIRLGKKKLSLHVFVNLLTLLKFKYKTEFIDIYLLSLENIRPMLRYRQICTSGKKYNIPILMPITKSFITAVRWLINSALNSNEELSVALFNSLSSSIKNTGDAVKYKREYHMLTFENRSYTYLLKKLKSGF